MKKLLSLLLILLMASSVFAQSSGVLFPDTILTDANNGETIMMHVNSQLCVQLPDERHFVSGNEQYGLEAVSTVSFEGLSNDGVLEIGHKNLLLGITLDDRHFFAIAPGQTTLSYKRMTSYVSYGNCPMPKSIEMQTISFNIVVTQ